MKIAVIDNYDSFVYNLVQMFGELGAEPVVFRNDMPLEKITENEPDAIVISPGPKTPAEAGNSVECVRRFNGKLPILGVCGATKVLPTHWGVESSKQRDLSTERPHPSGMMGANCLREFPILSKLRDIIP